MEDRLSYMSNFIVLLSSLILSGLYPFNSSIINSGPIRYADIPTIPFKWNQEFGDTLSISDPETLETIYQVQSQHGYPLYYYKDVSTEVCLSSECRPIQINIYWNITGRYLGYMLEDGQILSKREHAPFDKTDYQRLHMILSDPFIPFHNILFEELISSPADSINQVEGISGATSKDLSEYVVDGAAYTTFSLWQIIYGPLQSLIKKRTEHAFTEELLLKILQSSSTADQIWGLRRIDPSGNMDSRIANEVLTIITGPDYFTALTAINSITKEHLNSFQLQMGLFKLYQNEKIDLKTQLVDKLNEADNISLDVIEESRKDLQTLNGNQLGQWLDLYSKHGIKDIKTCQAVAVLLKRDNRYISNKAYQYLKASDLEDNRIHEEVQRFEKRYNIKD